MPRVNCVKRRYHHGRTTGQPAGCSGRHLSGSCLLPLPLLSRFYFVIQQPTRERGSKKRDLLSQLKGPNQFMLISAIHFHFIRPEYKYKEERRGGTDYFFQSHTEEGTKGNQKEEDRNEIEKTFVNWKRRRQQRGPVSEAIRPRMSSTQFGMSNRRTKRERRIRGTHGPTQGERDNKNISK